MKDIVVNNVRVLLKDEAVRLNDVKPLCISIYNVFTEVMSFTPLANIFFKYISNYNNILSAYDLMELVDNFKHEVKIEDLFDFKFLKRSQSKDVPNTFVKFETYKLFYYSFWPAYVKALKNTLDNGKERLIFRYKIKTSFVKRVYKDCEDPFYVFEKEIFDLFDVNEFEVSIKRNEEMYLIKI